MSAITCTRLIGKAGERCQTCGRTIIRIDQSHIVEGAYALQHEGPSISEKLHRLKVQREASEAGGAVKIRVSAGSQDRKSVATTRPPAAGAA